MKTTLNLKKYITPVRALQLFQIIRFGVLLLISIIFTKSKLGIGEIGVYETFLLVAGSVSFFWIGAMLQSMLAVAGNSKTFGEKDKNPVFFNIVIIFIIISFISAVFVYLSQGMISSLFSIGGDKIPYMKILFMYIIVSGPVNLIEYIYLLKDKSHSMVVYGMICFFLQLLCVTLPVLLGYDLGYSLYGLVFVNGLRFLWLIYLIFKYSEIKLSWPFLKEFTILSLPLVLSLLLSGSAQYIDGFLVSYKYDEATLAIFRYGARELPFIVLMLDAFGNVITSKFSNPVNRTSALHELKTGTARLMHWMFPLAIIFVLTSKFLFPIVFNKYFEESALIFNIYILIVITRFLFTRVILIGIKDTKPIFFASLMEIIINITLSIILINVMGIAGVAIGTIVSFLFEKFYLMIYLKIKHKITPDNYINLRVFSFYSLALISAFLVSLFF